MVCSVSGFIIFLLVPFKIYIFLSFLFSLPSVLLPFLLLVSCLLFPFYSFPFFAPFLTCFVFIFNLFFFLLFLVSPIFHVFSSFHPFFHFLTSLFSCSLFFLQLSRYVLSPLFSSLIKFYFSSLLLSSCLPPAELSDERVPAQIMRSPTARSFNLLSQPCSLYDFPMTYSEAIRRGLVGFVVRDWY